MNGSITDLFKFTAGNAVSSLQLWSAPDLETANAIHLAAAANNSRCGLNTLKHHYDPLTGLTITA